MTRRRFRTDLNAALAAAKVHSIALETSSHTAEDPDEPEEDMLVPAEINEHPKKHTDQPEEGMDAEEDMEEDMEE